MSTHPDAVGYLNDLAKEVDEPWFKMVCDLVSICGLSKVDTESLDALYAIYLGNASYIGTRANGAAGASPSSTTTDFLEQLSGFTNFKCLSNVLGVSFKKRITLVFGANGSGKSSFCESLKVLANPQQPNRPLENLRVANTAKPTFQYKFKTDTSPQMWTPSVGYGPRGATVKYFDTAIAIQNVTNPMEPGRVISIAPFKLNVFESVKVITTTFREALQRVQQENSYKLTQSLQEIRTNFAQFNTLPLALIDEKKISTLATQIKLGLDFKDQKLLIEKQTAASELEKATSDDGLKLLRAEHRELVSFLTSLKTLLTSTEELWALNPASKSKALADKQAAQEVLATTLIPAGGTLDALLDMLRAASTLCHLDEPEGHACPLCKRDLGKLEIELFKKYHALLVGELEQDITLIKADIAKAGEHATTVRNVDRNVWENLKTIPDEIIKVAKTAADLIVSNCGIAKEPPKEAVSAFESLKQLNKEWTVYLESKKTAIEAAAKGREELLQQLTKLRTEIDPLEYAHAISVRLAALEEVQQLATGSEFWRKKIPAFTQLFRKITEKAKLAYEELVVADFEDRLDSEYKALAEKDMAAFGVVLDRKGAEATVTLLPQVGGKSIEGVLSEGEQRIHALALFFAELETCPQSVLVFDDPISSFDYNYISNYCSRLRDFSMKFPNRQIIVLTHNWEFFVQLQTTLNQAGLNGHLSVQVLENCSVVADYSEKADELKADIAALLSIAGEPSKAQKEEMAGKMRRLMESIVNTHIFNRQRHQYKQKNQSVSDFHEFTKLVPLLPTEAITLRDLYGKLSISEHDDPRNAYVNTDKATFQARYDSILAVESAVVSRK